MFKSLYKDESGSIVSTELVLVASLLVVGGIAGLTSVRNAVDNEISDFSSALSNFDQSYSYGGLRTNDSFTAGSYYLNGNQNQQINSVPANHCLMVLSDGGVKVNRDKDGFRSIVPASNSNNISVGLPVMSEQNAQQEQKPVVVDGPDYSKIND